MKIHTQVKRSSFRISLRILWKFYHSHLAITNFLWTDYLVGFLVLYSNLFLFFSSLFCTRKKPKKIAKTKKELNFRFMNLRIFFIVFLFRILIKCSCWFFTSSSNIFHCIFFQWWRKFCWWHQVGFFLKFDFLHSLFSYKNWPIFTNLHKY